MSDTRELPVTAKAMAGQSQEERIRALEACVRELREGLDEYWSTFPGSKAAIARSLALVPEDEEIEK